MDDFSGLHLNLGKLSRLSKAQTRSISPENPTGEKGKASMATQGTGTECARDLGAGWKISPSLRMPPHQTLTLADIQGSGAIQQIWMTMPAVNRPVPDRLSTLNASIDRDLAARVQTADCVAQEAP